MNHAYSDEMTESIRRALLADSRFEFRREGDFLRQGVCPNCGKKTCYIKLTEPYRGSCDRLNKCGWSASTRDLYRDLFESLSSRIKPSRENPNATADAYMRDIRGFDLAKIRGMYHQGAVYVEAVDRYFPAVEVSIGPDYLRRYSSIACLNACLGIAPCSICGRPPFGIKRMDGMLRMPNAAARSGSRSVLTL